MIDVFPDEAAGRFDPPLTGVFHVLQRFPIAKTGKLCPVLFIEGAGGVAVHQGASLWAHSRLAAHDDRTLFTDLRVLGRLHDFHQTAWRGEPVVDDDRSAFLWCFLDARYHGTFDKEHLAPLNWSPIAYSSVRTEFGALARYYEFQHRQARWREEGFRSPEASEIFKKTVRVDAVERKGGFLNHLAASRARWAALFGSGDRMPDLGVREPARSGSTFSLDRTIDLEEARLIISREPNPVYKALWILGAFGGPRISEMLHMWQCDVLPASTGSHLVGRPQETLFVIVAHPAESRYLGDFTRVGETRLQHLARRYGLRPRHHLQGYRRVGWKNPLETDGKLRLSEVFWCDTDQANEFAESYAEVRHFHSKNETSDRHPYLWVTLAKGPGYGEPVSYAKAREAFYRACRRVGLKPSTNGRRIHGLRHVYKQQIEDLGLPPEYVQIALRHKSRESQNDYGKTAAKLRGFLSSKLHWKELACS